MSKVSSKPHHQIAVLRTIRKPLPRPSLILVNKKARARRKRVKRVDFTDDTI